MVCLALTGCGSDGVDPTSIRALTSGTEAVYRTPPGSESWLNHSVILTIYGRGFGVAPIVGRLGYDSSFADMHSQVQPLKAGIKRNDDGRRVVVAVHLIYGLAMPCSDVAHCVLGLDDTGVAIVREYIKPAQRLHWLVFLDTQLGTTSPAGAVERVIHRGYLPYDNVEVAIDPEFHLSNGYGSAQVPGLSFGSVTSFGINRAQQILSAYVEREGLPHKKILLVHQFLSNMIQERSRIRRFPNVQVVDNADGLGPPGLKVETTILCLVVSSAAVWSSGASSSFFQTQPSIRSIPMFPQCSGVRCSAIGRLCLEAGSTGCVLFQMS